MISPIKYLQAVLACNQNTAAVISAIIIANNCIIDYQIEKINELDKVDFYGQGDQVIGTIKRYYEDKICHPVYNLRLNNNLYKSDTYCRITSTNTHPIVSIRSLSLAGLVTVTSSSLVSLNAEDECIHSIEGYYRFYNQASCNMILNVNKTNNPKDLLYIDIPDYIESDSAVKIIDNDYLKGFNTLQSQLNNINEPKRKRHY